MEGTTQITQYITGECCRVRIVDFDENTYGKLHYMMTEMTGKLKFFIKKIFKNRNKQVFNEHLQTKVY